MELTKIIQEHPEINITVKGSDLLNYGLTIAKETAKEIIDKKEEKLYTRTEIMDKFDVCSTTLWRWDKLGIITSKKIGNRKYYPESQIISLISTGRREK
jgi:hypothetical protein